MAKRHTTFHSFVEDPTITAFEEKFVRKSRSSQVGSYARPSGRSPSHSKHSSMTSNAGGRRSSIGSASMGRQRVSLLGGRPTVMSPAHSAVASPNARGVSAAVTPINSALATSPKVNHRRKASSDGSEFMFDDPSMGQPGGGGKISWRNRALFCLEDIWDGIMYSTCRTRDEEDERVRFRRWLQKYMAVSPLGYFIDLANIFLSGVSCILYISETYQPEHAFIFEKVDVYFGMFFLFDYLLRLYLADQRLRYATTMMAVVDLITIVPVFLGVVTVGDGWTLTISLVRVLRVLRIVRINRFILSHVDSEVNKQITILILTIITAAIFCAGIVHIFENAYREANMMSVLAFHEALYFVIVTISTVGYGDISPASDLSRLVVAMLICAALVYIPKATNHLVTLMSAKSVYARNSYNPPPHSTFVLVCGSFDVVGATAFLTELFHEDHGTLDLQAVFLCEGLPSAGMENLLHSNQYSVNVTYLQGSPLDINDLMRASVLRASACFLLCNKFTNDPDTEDAATILRALSIKRFVLQITGRDILTCMQLMRAENKQHFSLSHEIMMKDLCVGSDEEDPNTGPTALKTPTGPTNMSPATKFLNAGKALVSPNAAGTTESQYHAADNASERSNSHYGSFNSLIEDAGAKSTKQAIDPVICVNEIKMNLLAQACLCPGIITMIGNLVMSVDAPPLDDSDEGDNSWLEEYHEGSEFEIYRTKLSNVFTQVPFCVASRVVHRELGALMFALELSVDGTSRVIMNPGKMLIPEIEDYDVHCFVMAQDLTSADLSSLDRFSEKEQAKSCQNVQEDSQQAVLAKTMKQMINRGEYDRTMWLLTKMIERKQITPEEDPTPEKRKSETAGQGFVKRKEGNKSPARRWGLVKNSLASPAKQDKSAGRRSTLDVDEAHRECAAENYFLLDHPKDLEQVTVRGSLKRDFPEIKDHIVICGNLAGLKSLIRTLRAKHLASMMPIVIVHPDPPSASLWNKIAWYPFIFFVQGNSTERNDLARAGIRYASRAIVLARSIGGSNTVNDETMSDAHAIFAHQGAIGMNKHIQLVTELINVSNVGFLDIGGDKANSMDSKAKVSTRALSKQLANANYHNALQFIAGIVYSSSMLDTLICQSFYNPHITTVFQQLIAGTPSRPTQMGSSESESTNEPEPGDSENVKKTYVASIRGSHLFQIPVPRHMHGRTYGDLFKELTEDFGMIPLGLLRGTSSQLLSSYKGNPIPYVYTNPMHGTLLGRPDKVFVLSKDAPSTKLAGKTVADVLKDMSTLSKQTKGMKDKSKAPPEMKWLAEELETLRKNVKDIKVALKKVSKGVSEGSTLDLGSLIKDLDEPNSKTKKDSEGPPITRSFKKKIAANLTLTTDF